MEEIGKGTMVPHFTENEAGNYSPLVLAFMGDAYYELLIRTMVVGEGNAPVNELNKRKNRFVKAGAQSQMMRVIEPVLTEAEEHIYRRGRNAKSYTMAKNATVSDYRRATGFEAVLGYLYLSGQDVRARELVQTGLEGLEELG